MMPRLITINEILEGDEIIISAASKLKYLKVLTCPRIKDYNGWRRIIDPITNLMSWDTNGIRYKSFRCTVRQDTFSYLTQKGKEEYYKKYVFEPDVSKHNVRISINLGGRDIYLVKRSENA
jgi:hypothetical protein